MCRIILKSFLEFLLDIVYWFKNNIRVFIGLIQLGVPYLMYWLCYKYAFNVFVLIIPIASFLIQVVMNRVNDKIGKGREIPIPESKFTQEDEDGEVSIDTHRLQEMILYVADVESYLERKHLI